MLKTLSRHVQFTLWPTDRASSRNNTSKTIWEEHIDSSDDYGNESQPTDKYGSSWASRFTAVNDLLSKGRGIQCRCPGRPEDGQWKEPKTWSKRKKMDAAGWNTDETVMCANILIIYCIN